MPSRIHIGTRSTRLRSPHGARRRPPAHRFGSGRASWRRRRRANENASSAIRDGPRLSVSPSGHVFLWTPHHCGRSGPDEPPPDAPRRAMIRRRGNKGRTGRVRTFPSLSGGVCHRLTKGPTFASFWSFAGTKHAQKAHEPQRTPMRSPRPGDARTVSRAAGSRPISVALRASEVPQRGRAPR